MAAVQMNTSASISSFWARNDEAVCIRRWVVDTYEIGAFRNGEKVWCEVIDQGVNESWNIEITFNGLTADEISEDLKSCEVMPNVLNRNIEFCYLPRKWIAGDREITLLRTMSGDLIWQIFNKMTQMATQINCNERKDLSLEDRVTYIHNCDIDTSEIGNNVIRIIPIVLQSILDPSKQISWNESTVTLITCGSSNIDPCSIFSHSAIITEHLDKGFYCMYKSHLVPQGDKRSAKTSIHYIEPYIKTDGVLYFNYQQEVTRNDRKEKVIHEQRLYDKKSDTFLRTSRLVIETLKRFDREYNSEFPTCAFNSRGSNALFVERKIYVHVLGIQEMPTIDWFEKTHAAATDVVEHLGNVFKSFGDVFSSREYSEVQIPRSTNSHTRFLYFKKLQDWEFELVQRYGRENIVVLDTENCATWAKKELQRMEINIPENMLSEILRESYGLWINMPNQYVK